MAQVGDPEGLQVHAALQAALALFLPLPTPPVCWCTVSGHARVSLEGKPPASPQEVPNVSDTFP